MRETELEVRHLPIREDGTLRDGDQKLDESETAAFRSGVGSVMYVALDRLEILHATTTVGVVQDITDGIGDVEWVFSRQDVP